jgi:hypothetical protein
MSHILWKSYLFATLFIRHILRRFEAKKAHFLGGLVGVSKTTVFETLLCGVFPIFIFLKLIRQHRHLPIPVCRNFSSISALVTTTNTIFITFRALVEWMLYIWEFEAGTFS